MGSRSLGELLLRPASSARLSLCHTRCMAPSWTTQRRISNKPAASAAEPQRTNDGVQFGASNPEPSQAPFGSPQARPRISQFTVRQSPSADDASEATSPLFPQRSPRSRSPPFSTRTQTAPDQDGRPARVARVFGSEFSNGSTFRGSRAPPKLSFDDMALPDDMLNPTLANKPSDAANLAAQQAETLANYPRLNPSYGRAIDLDPSRGRDIVRGINMLGSLVARNNIRRDQIKQRHHERPGLRRKRLASERWRAKFKQGFTYVTGRVSELTAKGW